MMLLWGRMNRAVWIGGMFLNDGAADIVRVCLIICVRRMNGVWSRM
jgi:hypothetical protein